VVLGTEDSQQTPPLFADLSGIVQFSEYGRGNESGLLGIAIHPKFKENGRWFGYYVTSYQQTGERKFRSVLSEFWSDPSAGYRFNPTSERVLLTTSQSQFDRHDGALQFGPDGFLYLGIGDGSVHPAQNVVQISSSYFGKLLRIDVDQRPSGSNYGIPLDNPWIDDHNTRPEIFAMGFRNIWGMDFHPENGTLFLADVGKEGWEEVNRITSGGNYGWKLREGSHSLESPEKEIPGESLVEDIIDPIWEYDHSNEWGKSITGGCFYSGKTIPALYNYYVYGDYVTGRIWALCYNFLTDKVVDHRSIEFQQSLPITTFGRRSDGEVFFAVPTSGGMLFRLTNADEE
jgi:quinoprotein glucose dehydrogenase